MRKIVVTGGAGFIGSCLVRQLIGDPEVEVVNVDKLTYAANPEMAEIAGHPNYRFVHADICDSERIEELLNHFRPQAIIHLAAESHVDRSIDNADSFVMTNIIGTYRLLEAARDYWSSMDAERQGGFRFHHVSTDEVYGTLGAEGRFHETTPYRPNSPYSASKASSDHLVRAWHTTYGLPVIVTNCSNNYGPYQFPEKLIPLTIAKALAGERLPVYGRGENVRDWLYVEDHARGLARACFKGRPGETYNLGGEAERTNLEVVERICELVDELAPEGRGESRKSLITFVPDRPGHDHRYAIDAGKIARELGWQPQESFESGLRKTVQWYIEHRDWWQRILQQRYRGERLGTAARLGAGAAER